jgi:hypothetical protein
MQVYAVMGGWVYEGSCGSSLQLFDCKSTAEAYAEELKESGYDYAYCHVHNVIEGSLLAQ